MNDAVNNICSVGLLRDMAYGLQLIRAPRVVRLSDDKDVDCCILGEWYAVREIDRFIAFTQYMSLRW